MVRATSWMIALGCLGAGGSGCGSGGGSGEILRPPADPTFGPSSTTTSTTTTGTDDTNDTDQAACSAEAPCAEGLFCAADSIGGGVVGHGPYACTDACVAPDDPTRWCLDDAACCDGLPCNNGLCGEAVDTAPTSSDDSGQGSSGDTTTTATEDTSGTGSTGGSDGGSTGDTGQ